MVHHSAIPSSALNLPWIERQPPWRVLAAFLLAYVAALYIGHSFMVAPEHIAAIWPASGIALAGLTLVAPRWRNPLWAMFTVATVAMNLYMGRSIAISVALASINAINTPLVAWWFRCQGPAPEFLTDPGRLLRQFLLPIALGSAIGAMLGGAAIQLTDGADWRRTAWLWFVSDALGMLVIAPVLLVWLTPESWNRRRATPMEWLESLCIAGLVTAVTTNWLLNVSYSDNRYSLRRPYTLLPILFFAGARLDPRLIVLILLYLATIATARAADTGSQFTGLMSPDLATRLLTVQAYLGVACSTTLTVVAMVAQRRITEQRLLDAHGDLEARVEARTRELRLSEERALQQSRELNTIYRTAPLSFCVLDSELKLARVNLRLVAEFGLEHQKLLGRPFADVLPALAEIAPLLLRAGQQGHEITAQEVRVAAPNTPADGRDWSVSCYPIDTPQGRQIGCILSDITEQKRAERQFAERRTELFDTARLNSLGMLAAGLAHELNQPLHAIHNYSRGCLRRLDLGQPGNDSLREALDHIAAEAQRAAEIVRRLREFVRRREPRSESVALNRVIANVVQLVDTQLTRSQMRLSFDLAAPSPTVEGDGIQLEQVVVNLVLNAIDASESRPVAMRAIHLATREVGARAEIVVQDSGPGVPAEKLQAIFEPFYTTKPAGLGLGLAISRSIVEAHGGTLRAETCAPHGSLFRMSLPIRVPAGPQPTGLVAEPALPSTTS
jgi:PAS domain S-box-containing protein